MALGVLALKIIMTKTKRIPKQISVATLERILSSHYGRQIKVAPKMEEDRNRWSGMPWDDGPLPEVLTGLFLTTKS